MEERTRDSDPETGYKVDTGGGVGKSNLVGCCRNVSEFSVRTTRDVSLLRR